MMRETEVLTPSSTPRQVGKATQFKRGFLDRTAGKFVLLSGIGVIGANQLRQSINCSATSQIWISPSRLTSDNNRSRERKGSSMKIEKILKDFRGEVKKLYGRKLKSIILYGSWARDAATEESDIDLLIVLEGKIAPGREIDRMIDIITELNLKYGVLISVYPISAEDYLVVNSPLLMNVRKEGVPA